MTDGDGVPEKGTKVLSIWSMVSIGLSFRAKIPVVIAGTVSNFSPLPSPRQFPLRTSPVVSKLQNDPLSSLDPPLLDITRAPCLCKIKIRTSEQTHHLSHFLSRSSFPIASLLMFPLLPRSCSAIKHDLQRNIPKTLQESRLLKSYDSA